MLPEDKRILELFAARVRELEPQAQVWAFGSRVRGDADEFSDLDVCVVVPQLTTGLREAITRAAWEVGFENGRLVTTVAFSSEQFQDGAPSESPLVKKILTEGLVA